MRMAKQRHPKMNWNSYKRSEGAILEHCVNIVWNPARPWQVDAITQLHGVIICCFHEGSSCRYISWSHSRHLSAASDVCRGAALSFVQFLRWYCVKEISRLLLSCARTTPPATTPAMPRRQPRPVAVPPVAVPQVKALKASPIVARSPQSSSRRRLDTPHSCQWSQCFTFFFKCPCFVLPAGQTEIAA